MDEKAKKWRSLWGPQPLDRDGTCRIFDDIRAAALQEPLEPLEPERVGRARHSMKAKAGLGVDQLSPLDMERLPFAGLVELTALLNACEECCSWPWQVLLVVGKLLGKKSGG